MISLSQRSQNVTPPIRALAFLRIEQISINGNFMRIGEETAFLKLVVLNLIWSG